MYLCDVWFVNNLLPLYMKVYWFESEAISLFFSHYFPMFNQARHMVIPYLPMLIPPRNWTGYEMFSPIIRTIIVSLLTAARSP